MAWIRPRLLEAQEQSLHATPSPVAEVTDQPVPWSYPDSTTIPLPHHDNCLRECHKFPSPAKRRGGTPGLAEERGQPAGNPHWHPQAGSTSHIPAWGKGQTPHPALAGIPTHSRQPSEVQEKENPLAVLTGRSVKAIPVGRKEQ